MRISLNRISFISFFLVSCFANLSLAIDLPLSNEPKIRRSLSKGEKYFGEINLTNPSNEPRQMRLYLEDWRYALNGDGAKEFFPAGSTKFSCAPWIKFTPAEFTLPPGARQKIHYTVTVPDKDVEGGYYAVLFYETILGAGQAQKDSGTAIDLMVRVGTLFYVEVRNTAKREVGIDKLVIEKKAAPKRLEVQADLKNTGNTDSTASGTFHIIDKKGIVYARSGFNLAYTFPGDSAKLKASWDIHKQPIPAGVYDIVLTVDIGKAQAEAGLGRGPIITQEAEIEINSLGDIVRIGNLK
jgi:hypothetical protein